MNAASPRMHALVAWVALIAFVAAGVAGCARPPAQAPRADVAATTELTSATAGGPEAPKVGKMQRDDEALPSEAPPLASEVGEPKRPERPASRRGAFGTWK